MLNVVGEINLTNRKELYNFKTYAFYFQLFLLVLYFILMENIGGGKENVKFTSLIISLCFVKFLRLSGTPLLLVFIIYSQVQNVF